MALAPEQRIRQAQVEAVVSGAPALRIAQAQLLAIYNYPASELRVNQAQLLAPVTADLTMRIAQAQLLAVVKGRIDDYELRAWTFDLDGHSFYVLKLGRQGTVVFDLTTGQWANWQSLGLTFWRAMTGLNWLGMGRATFGRGDGFDSNIVVGDDAHGLLWVLDPTQGHDGHPLHANGIVAMERIAMGQLPMRGRAVARCNGVHVTGSLGRPAIAGAAIILSTSDDEGQHWHAHGTIAVTPGDYNQEVSWRSMGQVRAPGRLFRVWDDGAMQRIDGLDMLPDDG